MARTLIYLNSIFLRQNYWIGPWFIGLIVTVIVNNRRCRNFQLVSGSPNSRTRYYSIRAIAIVKKPFHLSEKITYFFQCPLLLLHTQCAKDCGPYNCACKWMCAPAYVQMRAHAHLRKPQSLSNAHAGLTF